MLDVCAIAAVGANGAIGLNGKLPWRDKRDIDWFRNQVKEGIVVVGRKTHESMGELFDCKVYVWSTTINDHQSDTHTLYPHVFLTALAGKYDDWPKPPTIWIAGGLSIYKQWAPYVNKLVLTKINYNGPADTYFPFADYFPFLEPNLQFTEY